MDEHLPSTEMICRTALQIKGGVDSARAAGVDCAYPILFEIDGQSYSFATCVAECTVVSADGDK